MRKKSAHAIFLFCVLSSLRERCRCRCCRYYYRRLSWQSRHKEKDLKTSNRRWLKEKEAEEGFYMSEHVRNRP